MVIVYCITSKISGKSYIGMTNKPLRKRWLEHVAAARRGSPSAIHAAIRAYGSEPWHMEVLSEHETREQAFAAEAHHVNVRGTILCGYNMTLGGTGFVGLKRTPEHRAKIAAALKGKPKSEEHKRKLAEYKGEKASWWGRKHENYAEWQEKIQEGKRRARAARKQHVD